jgi:hypothetical protein
MSLTAQRSVVLRGHLDCADNALELIDHSDDLVVTRLTTAGTVRARRRVPAGGSRRTGAATLRVGGEPCGRGGRASA